MRMPLPRACFTSGSKASLPGWPMISMQSGLAVAAKPDCIEIMGHPGNDAFEPLVKQARGRGILITVGNSPLTRIQKMYGSQGTGYAGVDLYAGGAITASKMLD